VKITPLRVIFKGDIALEERLCDYIKGFGENA
jgi:hypothetical protein